MAQQIESQPAGRRTTTLAVRARMGIVLLWVALWAGGAQGQESVRMSIASSQAAEARRQAESTIGFYNLKLGPTGWRFGTALGIEYNDNVDNQELHQESDFIFRPQLNAQMIWPLSEKNSINLGVGVGYSLYAEHSRLNRLFLTPGSQLGFDLYVGDFWINLHDRFSVTEDSYQDPTVTGTGNAARFENDAGVSALWDLNKVIIRSGYDHITYISLGTSQGQPDGQSEVFSASAGYAIRSGMLLGLELGAGLIHYDSTNVAFSGARQWNAGAFYEGQLSEYMSFRGSAGYTVYSPDNTGLTNAVEDFTGIYAELGLTHRVNQYVDYTVSGGRSLNFSFYGGTIDLYHAGFQANWKVIRDVSLSTGFEYQHGKQISFGSETFDWYGPGISLGRPITSKLSSSLSYHYYWRGSDLPGRNYTVNVVALNLSYRF